jgi:hypothetical protein
MDAEKRTSEADDASQSVSEENDVHDGFENGAI